MALLVVLSAFDGASDHAARLDRRVAEHPPPPLTVNGITADFDAGLLRDASRREIALRAQSFAVLRHLARNAGRVVTKDELAAAVWPGIAVTDDSLVQCVRDIRRALRDEQQAVLKTVPKRGYRLVTQEPARPARARWLSLALAAGLAALLALGAAAWWRPDPASSERLPVIAVLPFDDMSPDQSLAHLGRGIADDLISLLAASPDVKVIARNSSFLYGGEPVDVRRIGRELGAGFVLEGSVRREGDRLRIVAQLNDARDGTHLWAERFDQAGTDPFALQDAVTERIIAELAGQRGAFRTSQQREAWDKDAASLDMYDYYLRAQDALYDGAFADRGLRAERIALEGLAKYPESGPLEIKLAWGLWLKAYAFQSDDPRGDMAQAARLTREVLASDDVPLYVERHARWLHAYVLMSEGDFTAAVAEAERTAAMGPNDAFVITDLTEILIPAGDYDRALEWLAAGEALNPKAADWYHAMRGWVYRLTGRYAGSVAEYAAASELWPYHRLSKAIAHVRLGQLDAARVEVRATQATDPTLTLALWREIAFYADPAIAEGELADLKLAGLPEKLR